MLPRNHPDRIRIAFDDHRLVANAGLILPATLAPAPRLAPTGPESPGLGRCTGPGQHRRQGDDPGGLRPGRRRLHRRRRCVAHRRDGPRSRLRSQSAIYPGDLRWGHARQLDRVSRQLLARAWAVGAGPGDAPLTIDLDSTICETCGLAKGGARHHGYTGARGYHPLLAIAAGTGDVLMARLREGRTNTARGAAAHFLRETVGRVRHAGSGGQLTVRSDSGFYTHAVVAVCRKLDVRFSITIRQHASLRNLIEAIPEGDWTPIPYRMDGAADVAETTCRACLNKLGVMRNWKA